jgi:uncharacterized membrane protein
MSWFVLSILYVIGGSIANIFRKILLNDERSDTVASAIIFQLLGAIMVGSIAVIHGFVIPPIVQHPFNFFLQACLWGIASLSLFKAYEYCEASEVTIITTSEAIVSIIVAIIFLGDTFSATNIIGTLLIILSVVIISFASKKFSLNKGVLYSLGYAFFGGIAIVNDKYLLHFSDTLSFLAVGFLTPGLFMMFVKPSAVKKIKSLLHPNILKKNIIFTFFFSTAGIAFYFALSNGGQASQVATIAQATVVITVILAIFVLNEKDHLLKKFVCAILVTIGVLLLR